ncbi:MAG: winged helix-turn-helix domain-containing protein, partial [Deltaproteobacteria bacterium]|nr:winged helix-turn-helix domain-containing protein [Deltaproteobacteria bacterium]
GEKNIELTGKEFRLLCLLAKSPGQIFSKAMLLDQVWDLNHFPESNVLEVTVANLRAKVDRGGKALIQSRRGVGYWLGEP